MKRILLATAACLLASTLHAQRDTTADGYDTLQTGWKLPFRVTAVFPLQIGNVWEYAEELSSTHQTSIERDILMPNGRRYAVLMSNQWVAGYLRQQGDTVFQYLPFDSTEEIVYDFSRSPGDTLIYRIGASNDTTILVVASVGSMQLFGRNLRYWTFLKDIRPYIDDELSFTVVDSIGLYELRSGFCPRDILTGSQIDGKVWGIVNAVEDQEHPPASVALLGNYPNPFNPFTIIKYTVGGAGD